MKRDWKAMTLYLPDREMKALDEMAVELGMTKTGVIRQAFRRHQSLESIRARGGEIIVKFPGEETSRELLVV